jgi:ParB-like chromosome segregation protein Spo0J
MLNPKQFKREVIPGEYHGRWDRVAKNRNFKIPPSVESLARDIAVNGIEDPVLVYKPEGEKKGVLVDGHHRVVAASMLGVDIPVTYTQDRVWEPQARVAREAHLYRRAH